VNLETFVVRGIAAQSACDAILSMVPRSGRVTVAELRAAEVRSLRRAMRVWAMTYRSANSRGGKCHALFMAVSCRERANALLNPQPSTCSHA